MQSVECGVRNAKGSVVALGWYDTIPLGLLDRGGAYFRVIPNGISNRVAVKRRMPSRIPQRCESLSENGGWPIVSSVSCGGQPAYANARRLARSIWPHAICGPRSRARI